MLLPYIFFLNIRTFNEWAGCLENNWVCDNIKRYKWKIPKVKVQKKQHSSLLENFNYVFLLQVLFSSTNVLVQMFLKLDSEYLRNGSKADGSIV